MFSLYYIFLLLFLPSPDYCDQSRARTSPLLNSIRWRLVLQIRDVPRSIDLLPLAAKIRLNDSISDIQSLHVGTMRRYRNGYSSRWGKKWMLQAIFYNVMPTQPWTPIRSRYILTEHGDGPQNGSTKIQQHDGSSGCSIWIKTMYIINAKNTWPASTEPNER